MESGSGREILFRDCRRGSLTIIICLWVPVCEMGRMTDCLFKGGSGRKPESGDSFLVGVRPGGDVS